MITEQLTKVCLFKEMFELKIKQSSSLKKQSEEACIFGCGQVVNTQQSRTNKVCHFLKMKKKLM